MKSATLGVQVSSPINIEVLTFVGNGLVVGAKSSLILYLTTTTPLPDELSYVEITTSDGLDLTSAIPGAAGVLLGTST